MCYMPTISQRELRNDNAEIVRGVERGESYTITRRGVPVAQLGPIPTGDDLPSAKPATCRPDWTTFPRAPWNSSTEHVLEDLRGDR